MSASSPEVVSATNGATRVLTLNRPEVKNALSAEMVAGLHAALDDAAADPAVRGIVLAGAGPDFCAGADLKGLAELAKRPRAENLADSQRLAKLFLAIATCDKPVVAAVRGFALAGGSGLACVCDRVVAADDAKFGFTEARIGFVAAIVARFVLDRVGPRAARDLLLTARRIDATEALKIGLADELAPAAEVAARAQAWIDTLRPCAPGSIALTKKLLVGQSGRGLVDALNFAAEMNATARAAPDFAEGVAAFLEKRKPRWLAEP
jgi:methylglutaconyl-CoA hydratase